MDWQCITIPPDKFDEEFHISNHNPPPKRNSEDKILNDRGKDIIEMCKSLELYIANGRKLGDPYGNFTCFKWNGNSVVDYLLSSESIFKKVSSFKVGDLLPSLSDHSPIIFTLEIHTFFKKSNVDPPTRNAPKQYLWHARDTERFLEALKLPENDKNVLTLDYANPNNAVDQLTKILLKTADDARIKTKKHSKNNFGKDPPWFDAPCSEIKRKIREMGTKIKRDPNNSNLKSKLSTLKRELKLLVRKNKQTYKESILQNMNLSVKDSKKFWKLLEKLEHKENDEIFKLSISDSMWTAHFKSVLQSNNNTPCNTFLPNNTAKIGNLDYAISDEELKLATYILRKGKATGFDSISNEMITCLFSTKPEVIKKLFNAILLNPTVINKWQLSVISPIHKKGSKTNPDNYRGISLLSCLGKLFSAVLNQRLLSYVTENDILSKAQLGFLPGNRTSDAHLILANLVEYYCKTKKTHLFGCFVDFSKAFDSIPRDILFKKLLSHNINGKFYDCLINMYTDDQACIKLGNRITNTFMVNQGVKQGCILSPLLFNIFLSDLQKKIEKNENNPAKISINQTLGCLIWADDLLLLSQTETGLQNMLDTLNTFSRENGLSINMDKTKVMIFNKTGRHMRRNFFLGAQKVETTRDYKYLGFKITPSGEITTGLKDLKDRATKAFFKLKIKMASLFRRHIPITIKLFETLIKPILLYCSDFWGIRKMPKNNPFQTLHMKFCKQLLGVQKQTTNIGVLLELGQVPLELYAIKNSIKNWTRIACQKKANELVTASYKSALLNNLEWPAQIEKTLSQIGFRQSFLTNEDISHLKVFQRLCDNFHQNAFSEINKEDSKLRTFKLVKTTIGLEKYLIQVKNVTHRISLTKLRLSNHPLMIEKGRHLRIPKHLRMCPFCLNTVEDEVHFLIDCKCFVEHKKQFINEINIFLRDRYFLQRSSVEQFIAIITNVDMSSALAKHVNHLFQIREFLIRNHKNRI